MNLCKMLLNIWKFNLLCFPLLWFGKKGPLGGGRTALKRNLKNRGCIPFKEFLFWQFLSSPRSFINYFFVFFAWLRNRNRVFFEGPVFSRFFLEGRIRIRFFPDGLILIRFYSWRSEPDPVYWLKVGFVESTPPGSATLHFYPSLSITLLLWTVCPCFSILDIKTYPLLRYLEVLFKKLLLLKTC